MSREQILEAETRLNQMFIGRKQEIHGLILAALSKKHVLFIGPPGTAKTALANKISEIFSYRFNSVLMSSYVTPDEIFGPISFQDMKDKSLIRRDLVDGIAGAEFVLLDEVFKAGAAIPNTMLSLMEERRYRNGSVGWVDVPLITLIGTSNELPDKDDGLEAFNDRFTLRFVTSYMDTAQSFRQMLRSDLGQELPRVEGLAEVQNLVANLKVPGSTYECLEVLWEGLRQEEVTVSDRKFKHLVEVMSAESYLAGFSQVVPESVRVAKDVLWTKPEDYRKVARLALTAVNPNLVRAQEIVEAAKEALEELGPQPLDQDLYATITQVKELRMELVKLSGVDEQRQQINGILEGLSSRVAGL